jgi:hypothetical protein
MGKRSKAKNHQRPFLMQMRLRLLLHQLQLHSPRKRKQLPFHNLPSIHSCSIP